MKDELNVLYEDNHVIVVVKPPNILSQSDITRDLDMLSIIKSYLKEKYHKPGNVYLGLVHRLDRPVGGVMVFAKTSKAASRLSEQVRNHDFKKKYYAVVYDNGTLKDSDTFIDYLVKDNNNDSQVTDKSHGKYASLSYNVMERNKKLGLSLVDISLETGRHHQIRVQFASRGFPLYGDQKYGKQDRKQIALYAYLIEFIHPTTKERMVFSNRPVGNIWEKFKI